MVIVGIASEAISSRVAGQTIVGTKLTFGGISISIQSWRTGRVAEVVSLHEIVSQA